MAKQSITINGIEYTEDMLTDTQKVLVNHCLNLDAKIQNQVFQLEQLQGGRAFFMGQLEASLKETNEVGNN